MAKGESKRLKFSERGTNIIIQYIETALPPTENGEILTNGDLAAKGRLRRWFMDILEGQCPVIKNMDKGDWFFVRRHYVYGKTWKEISEETYIPVTTLRYRKTRFFKAIIESMPHVQGIEILRIHRRHESDDNREARWDDGKGE